MTYLALSIAFIPLNEIKKSIMDRLNLDVFKVGVGDNGFFSNRRFEQHATGSIIPGLDVQVVVEKPWGRDPGPDLSCHHLQGADLLPAAHRLLRERRLAGLSSGRNECEL